MDRTELFRMRNEIGSLPAIDGEYPADDNIGIALAKYFETRSDRPEDDKIDKQLGSSKWAIEKTEDALDRIVKHLTESSSGHA